MAFLFRLVSLDFFILVVSLFGAAPYKQGAEALRIFNYHFNERDFERGSTGEFSACSADHSVEEIDTCVIGATGSLPYALLDRVYFANLETDANDHYHYAPGAECCIKWTVVRCLRAYLERVANSTAAPNCGHIREKLITPLDQAVARVVDNNTASVCGEYRNQSSTNCDAFRHLSCEERYKLSLYEMCQAPNRMLPVKVLYQAVNPGRNRTATISETQFRRLCCTIWDEYACMQRHIDRLYRSPLLEPMERITKQDRDCMYAELQEDEQRIHEWICGPYREQCGYRWANETMHP